MHANLASAQLMHTGNHMHAQHRMCLRSICLVLTFQQCFLTDDASGAVM